MEPSRTITFNGGSLCNKRRSPVKSLKGCCCCNYKYHLSVGGHPWVNGKSCSTHALWVCAPEVDEERHPILSRKHGICEMHELKKA